MNIPGVSKQKVCTSAQISRTINHTFSRMRSTPYFNSAWNLGYENKCSRGEGAGPHSKRSTISFNKTHLCALQANMSRRPDAEHSESFKRNRERNVWWFTEIWECRHKIFCKFQNRIGINYFIGVCPKYNVLYMMQYILRQYSDLDVNTPLLKSKLRSIIFHL